jgi:hypothetical protein
MGFLKNLFTGKYFGFHKSEKKKDDSLDSYILGCTPTSAISHLYDERGDYPNIIASLENTGGLPAVPVWGARQDGGPDQASNIPPVTAKGSIDDYWFQVGNLDPDPSINDDWKEHNWDTLGDFMYTSKLRDKNTDGDTKIYTSGSPSPD